MKNNSTINQSWLAMAMTLLSLLPVSAIAANISSKQVTVDITFLASDQLAGRANFSTGIDEAADYISKRFSEIGLTSLKDLNSFKQSFSISKIMPESMTLIFNGKNIAATNLAMASTLHSISWQDVADFNFVVISAQDNMRQVIGKLNQQGGKHLVLLSTAHAKLFARYRSYFQAGLTKLNLDHQGAIVVVLTDETAISTINFKASTRVKKQMLSNVVGVLPGKTRPEEFVLYSAHYDHLGVNSEGDNGKSDLIYNGADDDASGTTAVINLAEYFAKKSDNTRTLVFTAFAAEEIGGFGSRYFSEQLEPERITAMINIEMIGKPSKFGEGTLWMTGMQRSNLGTLLNAGLKAHNKEIYEDPYPEQGLFYRSDNASLARLGVPAHSFSSTQLDKDQHYHQVSDDIKSLNLISMHNVIDTLAIATQGLVDGTDTPTRLDTNKVRGSGKIY
jgi:aminopeptidase YwaD